ncbi:MAG: high-potential iron-sulfur protein [Nitrococcus sp.]|nr:high-potential iron-sulfur protein [Nitrococcus sp.]
MNGKKIDNSRRKLIKGALAGAAALPFAGLLQRGWAQGGKEKVDPGSSQAQALHYTHDAAALPKSVARKPNELCHNCRFFQAQAAQGSSPQWAPCTIFGGKLVSRDGWCSSWTAQSG